MAFPDRCKQTSKSKLLEEVIPEILEKTGEIKIAKNQCVYLMDMTSQKECVFQQYQTHLSNWSWNSSSPFQKATIEFILL